MKKSSTHSGSDFMISGSKSKQLKHRYIYSARVRLMRHALADALFARCGVGWALQPILEHGLVLAAVRHACQRHQVAPVLLHHSDRESQYTSGTYQATLAESGSRPDISLPINLNSYTLTLYSGARPTLWVPKRGRENDGFWRTWLPLKLDFVHGASIWEPLLTAECVTSTASFCISLRQHDGGKVATMRNMVSFRPS